MIYDDIKNVKNYPLPNGFAKAFKFLSSVNADTPDGTYELDGRNVYAMVQSGENESGAPSKLEVHRKYADVQYCIAGAEILVCTNADSSLEILTPYNPENDAEFLRIPPDRQLANLEMTQGKFAVFFPQDAHFGRLEAKGKGSFVKKVVVKVAI